MQKNVMQTLFLLLPQKEIWWDSVANRKSQKPDYWALKL